MNVRVIKLLFFFSFMPLSYLLYISIGYVLDIIVAHTTIALILFYVFVLLYCAAISTICYLAIKYCEYKNMNCRNMKGYVYFPWKVMLILFLFSGLLVPYYYIKLGCYFWGNLAIVSVCLLFVFAIVAIFVIKCTSMFKAKIVLRRALFFYLYFTLLIIFVGSIPVYIYHHIPYSLGSYDLLLYYVGIRSSDLYILICSNIIGVMVFKSYTGRKYILYLRNFIYDKESRKGDLIDKIASISRQDILRIGNPKTLFALDFSFTTFYLPEVNWQNKVSQLIDESEMCFVVLDVSDGVLWETCNHLDFKYKFIYHISNPNSINNIVVKLREGNDDVKRMAFAKDIELIMNEFADSENDSYTFMYIEDVLYCSPQVDDILRLWKSKGIIKQQSIVRI